MGYKAGLGTRKLLLVTFDLVRRCDPTVSVAAGYLMSRLRAEPSFGEDVIAEHESFNLLSQKRLSAQDALDHSCETHNLTDLDFMAVSCYIWCEYLMNDFLRGARERGFEGQFILGGYQIHSDAAFSTEYPEGDIFVSGYGEEALVRVLKYGRPLGGGVVNVEPNLAALPSPYLDGTIQVSDCQGKVRLETKRGCPFACSFCGHRDLCNSQVYYHPLRKVKSEIEFFKNMRVRKINIIDPLFNWGETYMPILEFCARELCLKTHLSLQVRADLIRDNPGEQFLELCTGLNTILELGIESIHKSELDILNRPTDLNHIRSVFTRLRQLMIPFEISLIYGLPNQTPDSFKASVAWAIENGCSRVSCFPLKLIPGTMLHSTASKLKLVEEKWGYLDIPYVISADTFDSNDWEEMRTVAGAVRRSALNRSIPTSEKPCYEEVTHVRY